MYQVPGRHVDHTNVVKGFKSLLRKQYILMYQVSGISDFNAAACVLLQKKVPGMRSKIVPEAQQ